MPLITFGEIIDLLIMTFFVGYIFSGIMPVRREEHYDPLVHYKKGFDFDGLKFAIMATAPAIILHELAHKFVAIGFGLNAIFSAFYRDMFTLMLGILTVISKLTGFGFMFFVPGFVRIAGNGTHLQFALTAFAGPLVNLVLWLVPLYLIKNKLYKKKHYLLLLLTQRINMFLFIFNMLPLPGFDGYKVFTGLISTFSFIG
jgi:Zn-dependent protease